MITIWTKSEDDIVAKEIDQSQIEECIKALNAIMNDPDGSITRGIKDLFYIWTSITDTKDIRFNLELWFNMMRQWHLANNRQVITESIEEQIKIQEIKICPHRLEKKIEKTCCGGKKDIIVTYHCELKKQPTTALGCRKCKL